MKHKTSTLSGRLLSYAAALADGRPAEWPPVTTYADVASLTVPFTMYEVTQVIKTGEPVRHEVRPITVTRYGILPGCSSPSIDITDRDGRKAHAGVGMFYLTKEEAELDAQCCTFGAARDCNAAEDWSEAGPMIERHGIGVAKAHKLSKQWVAAPVDWAFLSPDEGCPAYGTTPIEAALRCLVHSKFGDEVELPDNLES